MKTHITSLLVRWVALVTRRPLVTLVLAAALVAGAGVFAVSTLSLQSDVTELVDTDAAILQSYNEYKNTFPQHRRLNVVVIDGVDARRARLAESALLEGMAARADLFANVYAPASDPFVTRHALLYLEPAQLEEVVDALAAVQPALAILARDPSLRGLAELFASATADGGQSEALAPLAEIVARTARGVASGDARAPSWAEVMLGDAAPTRRLIVFQGSLSGDDGRVAREQAAAVREVVEANALTEDNGITVRMTGRGPLSSAELESAISSIQTVGLVSLALVGALLWIGLGSLRAILAALVTLVSGLVLTAGFAALTIGSLNVLSLTFAVLFIGLGIDFAIHLVLRRIGEGSKAGEQDGGQTPSWADVMRGLGPTISLCGLTTAVAFLSFWPTRFQGLAELGLISAAGMVIAVVVSFTILPPLLDLVGTRAVRRAPGRPANPDWLVGMGMGLGRLARPISLVALVLLVAAAAVGLQVRFDFNSLNLQDPDSEAVRTLTDLHADGTVTPYTLTIAAPGTEAADEIARELRALPEVGEAKTLHSFVPADQGTRLAILDTAQVILGPAVMFMRPDPLPDADAREAALEELIDTGRKGFEPMATALAALPRDPATLSELEALLSVDFVESLAMLREALSAQPIDMNSLPGELVARETGTGGEIRVVALPRDDLRDFEALGAFVDAVHALYPDATGRPALEAGVGAIVVDAFRQAFITAAIVIAFVLVVALRSLVDALLVMVPLVLAAALTAAVMVALSIPLNVANVIVLPLLLGMGVDNGLHVVGRYRETNSLRDVFASTTPRAVVTSVLTTLLSFVALAFAEHRGMSSMGLLLAIAIGFILFATLIVLPALLAWRAGKPQES